jgi:murein DD-endopeptidase MepM/ murein hydrolase activator NlpD
MHFRIACLGLCAFALLSACTQPPVEVVDKGSMFFGHDVSSVENSNEGAYDNHFSVESNGVQEPASVGSVGVSDLKPITSRPLDVRTQSGIAPLGNAPQHVSFIWPVEGGRVAAHYSSTNDGVTILAKEGTPILAAADGTVVYAGNELKAYGNMLIIRHAGGFMTAYAHAQRLTVRKNDHVRQGDIVAYVGKTGDVRQPELHFGLRAGRKSVDPEQYLPRR